MDDSAFRGLGEALVAAFWVAAVAVIFCAALVIYMAYSWITAPDLKREAIQRGYAVYCPADGHWAWVGECEDATDDQ